MNSDRPWRNRNTNSSHRVADNISPNSKKLQWIESIVNRVDRTNPRKRAREADAIEWRCDNSHMINGIQQWRCIRLTASSQRNNTIGSRRSGGVEL